MIYRNTQVLGIGDITNDGMNEIFLASLHDGSFAGYDAVIISCSEEGECYLAGGFPTDSEDILIGNRYNPDEGKVAVGGSSKYYTNAILTLMGEEYLLQMHTDIYENKHGSQYYVKIHKAFMDGDTKLIKWDEIANEEVTLENDDSFQVEKYIIMLLIQSGEFSEEEYAIVYGGEKFVPNLKLLE